MVTVTADNGARAADSGPVVDDYPYRGQGDGVDPWSYFRGECTSFVAWRINDRLGINFHNWYLGHHFGDARTWDEAARGVGLTVNSTPRPGSVAQSDAGSFGHVAWVSKVNVDGTVLIEEYNHATRHSYGTRTVSAASFEYIHFAGYSAAESIDGDRHDDLLAVDGTQTMWRWPGQSQGTFGPKVRVGPGWVDNYDRIAVGDVDGDGYADLIATATDGLLFYWRNRGNGSFHARAQVGNGWKSVSWLALSDVNGDNRADIILREASNMSWFRGDGDGTFSNKTLIGPGWASYYQHWAGDASGDGKSDIWAVRTDGDLYFWRGNGAGGFSAASQVGSGWNSFSQIGVLDVNGDGRADIVAVKKSDNTLWRWAGIGDGRFNAGTQIGHGWGGLAIAGF